MCSSSSPTIGAPLAQKGESMCSQCPLVRPSRDTIPHPSPAAHDLLLVHTAPWPKNRNIRCRRSAAEKGRSSPRFLYTLRCRRCCSFWHAQCARPVLISEPWATSLHVSVASCTILVLAQLCPFLLLRAEVLQVCEMLQHAGSIASTGCHKVTLSTLRTSLIHMK